MENSELKPFWCLLYTCLKVDLHCAVQKIANSAKQSLDLSVDGMQLTKVESERVLGVFNDYSSSPNGL